MLTVITVLAIALCNGALGLIVLLKNRRNAINIYFSIFAFSLAIWTVITYYSNDTHLSHANLLLLTRLSIFIPNMAMFCLVLFSLKFTGYLRNMFNTVAWILGLTALVISYLSVTSWLIGGIIPKQGVVILKFGWFAPIFTVFIIGQLAAVIFILLSSVRRLTGSAKARVQYMAFSLFITLTILVITSLIMPLVFHIYTYGNAGLLSSIIIVGGYTYAIVKHRLFDIRAVVARAVTYIMLLFTLGSAYAFIAFKIGGLLFTQSNVSSQQQTFNIVTALILAFTFQPLQRIFEKITDRIFFHDRYDPEALVNCISKVLASEIELITLSHRVRSILAHDMRVDQVNIVVLNNNQVFAEAGHYVVSRLGDLATDLASLHSKFVVTEEEPDGHRKDMLKQYGISVMTTLRTHEDGKIGYLLFGEKLNGDVYTSVDLRVIHTIADQLAVGIQNAKAYMQIKRFNRTLQSKVADATQQLREANVSLQQLDHAKDDFISISSHQLRTPLTIIDGYLSNLLDGIYGKFNEKQREAIALTRNRLRLTRALVADLLNVSRMEAGRFFIETRPVDLAMLVPEEIEQLKLKALEFDVKLAYIPPSKAVPILKLDESKTRQAIMNIIDNAITYTPKGTVKVQLKVEDKAVVFEVADNGIGVPKDQQEKLFNKFFRASNAQRVRPDGTGIGLYLVKRVVEEQGGSISFVSQSGKGSTVGFRLPTAGLVTTAKPSKARVTADMV